MNCRVSCLRVHARGGMGLIPANPAAGPVGFWPGLAGSSLTRATNARWSTGISSAWQSGGWALSNRANSRLEDIRALCGHWSCRGYGLRIVALTVDRTERAKEVIAGGWGGKVCG